MNDDLTPEQEGARLKELLGNRNKAQFAKDAKIPGGASMLSQHLSGHRPISLTAATAYALGLGVGVEEFSPRLAKAIAEANRATTANPPSGAPRPGCGTTSAPYEAPSDSGKPDLVITQYEDTGGAMGHGFNLTDHPPGHIKSWRVTHEWLRLNVPSHTGVKNLAIVTGFGPSMKPMFNPGDPLLVDVGVKVIDHEGVYFFRVGDEGFIKLIQRVPEFDGPGVRLRVISKNPDYPPYDISPKNPHFEVLGKVLTVWRSEQF